MREISELSNILWERILKLRRNSCIGCICNHNSQKFHDICLTNIYHNYYYSTALNTLFYEKLISNQEKQFLDNLNSSLDLNLDLLTISP
jgi:hypothetical protein